MAEAKSSLDKLAVLRGSSLSQMLSPAELEVLAELARPRRFERDQVVLDEGEMGDSLYVIASGEVEVLLRHDSGEPKVLARLGAPDFFGEMAVVDREARSATVRTATDLVALQLTAENLSAFRKHSRDGFTFLVINIARALSGRLRDTNAKLAAHL